MRLVSLGFFTLFAVQLAQMVDPSMKVVFFGSPSGAVPALEALTGCGFDLRAVYTRADKPSGRARKPVPTAVKVAAQQLNVPVRTPRKLNDPAVLEEVKAWNADAFVVVAYGMLLPKGILDIPPLGCVNVHPSLLPRHRGPSPVSTAILSGDAATGVTLIRLDAGMDTGPILSVSSSVSIAPDERGGRLLGRLLRTGGEMLPYVLPDLAGGRIEPVPQNNALATVTPFLTRESGKISWNDEAAYIERMIRAFDPWPGTWTTWNGRRLKLFEASCTSLSGKAGEVFIYENKPGIFCGDGALLVTSLQLEGKRAIDAGEFVRGNPSIAGQTLV